MYAAILPAFLVFACLAPLATASGGTVRAASGALVHQGPGPAAPADPVVEGAGIQVTGCLAARDWCRVIVDGLPGWMEGRRLLFEVGGRTVTVAEHGARLEIPVITPGSMPPGGRAVDVAPPGG
jgi:uncharacterized protein YraI